MTHFCISVFWFEHISFFIVLSKILQDFIHASFLTKHRSLEPSFTVSNTTKLNHFKAV